MRKLALAGAVLAVAAGAAGCAGLQDLARSAIQPPKLTFRSASLQALDLEGATVAFLFDLANPNSVGAEVARAAWTIETGTTRLAAGDLPAGLKVPANGTAPVSFPVRLRFKDVPGIVSLLGGGKDELPYALSGTIGVKTPVGILDVPLSHSGNVPLPKLPRLSLEGLAVRSVSFQSVGIGVRLRVANPNRFPLPAGALDYALALGGAPVARADGVKLEGAPGGGSAVVELPVRVELASAGRAASALVQGGEVDVRLTGNAEVAGLPMPLDLRARLPARR